MLIALWIVNAVLALLFLAAGGMKASTSRTALQEKGMGWTEDFGDAAVKAIGAVEVLAAIGLIAPLATGIAPILTPLAAVGLAITMIGATVVHARRDEPVVPTVVLTVVAVASAALGFAQVL
ncbi:DoxX family protein [Demequina iriomotensis]|uniref:DoxX family protein n=1 Tax=Demequina iriomotensis TaxID=1536641 RepID=UPI000785F987|nr:DoxX family protein [Demequina iriomotensis]